MARKSGLLMALALLVFLPASVSSLGLGEIRLNSYLNEPLDAEVTITTASAEELESLKVAVASQEAFERFGIERPAFLRDLSFDVVTGPGGSATLRIRSPEPVVEPFLTFLVEADWAGGRLLREYTVLLDPPLFLPEPQQALQPAAPVAEAPGAGVITRPQPDPTPAPTPRATVAPPAAAAPAAPPQAAPAAPSPAASAGSSPTTYGPVRRNDTLWRIASEVRPDRSVTVNQTMLALFESNPDAFEGNINVLRAGAVLTVPTRDQIASINSARATAEVRRQHTEWEPGAAAAAPVPAPTVSATAAPASERLELVVPGEQEAAPAPAAPPAAPESAPSAAYLAEQEALNNEMLNALQSLRQELEETQRLIDLKDAEIAALQGRLSDIESGTGVPAAGEPVGAMPVDAPVEAAIDAPLEVPVDPADAPSAAAEPVVPTEPAPVEATEPAVTEPVAAEPEPAPAPAPPATPETGGLFSSMWFWLVAALVVLLGLAVLWKRRQEQQGGDDDFATFEQALRADAPAQPVAVATGAAAGASFLVEEQAAPAREKAVPPPVTAEEAAEDSPALAEVLDEDDFEETGSFTGTGLDFEDDRSAEAATPPPPESAAATAEYQYPFEDTIAGASGINLDQSDPLAEADFHMAYGLYDQAADLIGKAVEREPDRIDLRMKLLDILFVWGKEDRFLTESRALKDTLGADSAGDWGRVVIMGRQICPDEPLFEGEGGDDVDVAVEASGDAAEPGTAAAGADVLDFDIGADEAATDTDDLLDFDLGRTGEYAAASDGAVSKDETAELDIEDLGLDLDLGDATGEILAGLAATGETPELDVNLDALRSDSDDEAHVSEGTAEMLALADAGESDDLGEDEMTRLAQSLADGDGTEAVDFDLGGAADESDTGVEGDDNESVGMTGLTEILESTASVGDGEGPVVAETLQMPKTPVAEDDAGDYTDQLEGVDFATQRLTAVIEQPDVDDDDTAQVEAVEDEDPSLDLNDITAALSADLEATTELPRGDDESDADKLMGEIFGDEEATRIAPGIDVITGGQGAAVKEEKVQPAPPDVTLDEVGTKLDLARAYIDMGDPDGAKSILEEVLTEGDDRQKDEAQQLMDGVT